MKLEWLSGSVSSYSCPICSNHDASKVVSVEYNGDNLTYLRCTRCKTLFPHDFKSHDDEVGGYQIGRSENDLSLKHYVEIGAGIESLLAPVLRMAPDPGGALLDIGCGFGFLVDIWAKISLDDSQSSGIELASYGYWGKEILGVDITHDLLHENVHVSNKSYKYIFAGEVIEHVSDPRAFVRDIVSVMDEDAILIITTPSADFVVPERSHSFNLASLYPGAHQFLLTADTLKQIIVEAGLIHVEIEISDERLVAWASQSPLPYYVQDAQRLRQFVTIYLERLSESSNGWLKGGALYRLFRDAVNFGNMEYADTIDQKMAVHLADDLGPDHEWEAIVDARLFAAEGDALIKNLPTYLGPYLYYRGLLQLNWEKNPIKAASSFLLALKINQVWAERLPSIAQEPMSLVGLCYFHALLALSCVASRTAGLQDRVSVVEKASWPKISDRIHNEIVWPDIAAS